MVRVHTETSSREEPNICVKYTLYFMNVLFWIAGVIILGIGIYVMVEKREVYNELSHLTLDPAVLFVFVGGMVFVVTFTGCIGALRENSHLLGFYAVVILILLILEVTCGTLSFIYRERVKEEVESKLRDAVVLYRDPARQDLQLLIDTTQIKLRCCGVNSYEEWRTNVYFKCDSPGVEACGVPFSCCKGDRTNLQCGYGAGKMETSERLDAIHTRGCLPSAILWFQSNLLCIGIFSFVVLLLQIISIYLAETLRGQVLSVKERIISRQKKLNRLASIL